MTATILFVDDEADLEALVLQKFRRQIREGAVNVIFARDGLEALQTLEQNPDVDARIVERAQDVARRFPPRAMQVRIDDHAVCAAASSVATAAASTSSAARLPARNA